jgi:murein DD-endopeptidase MepM/ murein hydrolase activator NlpD
MKKIRQLVLFLFLAFSQTYAQNGLISYTELTDINRFFDIVDTSYFIKKDFPSSQWHGRAINPFKFDMTKFKESVEFALTEGEVHQFHCPHPGRVTSCFGPRWGSFHYGTDILLNVGDTVYAAIEGVVRIATWEPGYGNFIVLTHEGGLESLYGHLSGFMVKPEDTVKAGQPIAFGGNTGYSTGPHLHFEIRYLGAPLNVEKVFDFYKKQLKTDYLVVNSKTYDHLKNIKPRGYATPTNNHGGTGALYYTIKYCDCLYNLAIRY